MKWLFVILIVLLVVYILLLIGFNIRGRVSNKDQTLLEAPINNGVIQSDTEKILKDLKFIIDNEANKAYDMAIMKRISSELNAGQSKGDSSYRMIFSEDDKNIVLRDTYNRIENMLSSSFYDKLGLIFKNEDSINTYILDELNYNLTTRVMKMNEKI